MLNQRTRRTHAVLLVIALTTGGCGGGGGGGGNPGGTPAGTTPPDTTAPDTTITTKPAASSNSSTANFSATSSEAGSTFESSLDSAAFAAVTLPLELSGLADGSHTFSIRARDAAGNVDASPATYTWTIDTTGPSAKIIFPLPNSYTDANTLTIRGTATETNGIASVRVNDVAATSTDNFATWSAVVPIHSGENAVVVSTTDKLGNTTATAAAASVLNRGPVVASSSGIALDTSNGHIVVADEEVGSIYTFDASTGFGSRITPATSSTLKSAEAIGIDQTQHRAVVVDGTRNDMVVSVDLETGDVTDLSASPDVTDPTFLFNAASVVVDSANHRAFVGSSGSIVQVDLNGGARTVISSSRSSVGSGPDFYNGSPYLVLDSYSQPGTLRLVGAVRFDDGVVHVIAANIANGTRTIIDPSDGTSPALQSVSGVALDPISKHLLVLDREAAALVSVDLATGNRTIVTSSSTGSGTEFAPTQGLTLSAQNKAIVAQYRGELVSVDLSTGTRELLSHSRIGSGSQLSWVQQVKIEQTTGEAKSLLVLSGGQIVRLDLTTGDRTVVAPADANSNPYDGLTAFCLDTRPGTHTTSVLGIVGFTTELVAIDLATGTRTHVGDLGLPGYTNQLWTLDLDPGTNRLYFTNRDATGALNSALYSYDLTNNQRTTIADKTTGTGPNLVLPMFMTVDAASGRAIISDSFYPNGPLSVNLATGERTSLMWDSTHPFSSTALHLDAAHSEVFGVSTVPMHSLFTSSLDGNATIVSGLDATLTNLRGTGPAVGSMSLDVDRSSGIVYAESSNFGVVAVDLVSGDRVLIAH